MKTQEQTKPAELRKRIKELEALNAELLGKLSELAFSTLLADAALLDPGYLRTRREAMDLIAKAEGRE